MKEVNIPIFPPLYVRHMCMVYKSQLFFAIPILCHLKVPKNTHEGIFQEILKLGREISLSGKLETRTLKTLL